MNRNHNYNTPQQQRRRDTPPSTGFQMFGDSNRLSNVHGIGTNKSGNRNSNNGNRHSSGSYFGFGRQFSHSGRSTSSHKFSKKTYIVSLLFLYFSFSFVLV